MPKAMFLRHQQPLKMRFADITASGLTLLLFRHILVSFTLNLTTESFSYHLFMIDMAYARIRPNIIPSVCFRHSSHARNVPSPDKIALKEKTKKNEKDEQCLAFF